MRCFVLDATNKSITAVLAGAAATTNPDFTAAYGDAITTTFTEGANDGALNGTTPVTIVAAPAASTRRIVTAISIQNRDTAAVVLTVRYVDGANTRQIWSGTLAVGDTWTMDGVMNALGSMKTAFAGSHTALSDIGTNTHAQVDTHIAASAAVHGLPASVNVLGNRNAAGEFVQRGWDFVTGDGTTRSKTKTVTFPVAFTTLTGFATNFLGYKTSGDPNAITNFLPAGGDLGASAQTLSTTTFELVGHALDAVNLANGTRVGLSWVAIGT